MKKVILTNFRKRRYLIIAVTFLFLLGYWFCLPPLFEKTAYSKIIEDQNGRLLSARIAADGQWRFPVRQEVPVLFIKAITTFEDKRFFRHPGVDILGLFRAMRQNLQAKKVVSGASTLSMQVIRLAKHNPPRTIWEKIKEIIQATRLELTHSKLEIMALYAAHAPFGGNVVGLEAAAWRYFGTQPKQLSWAETATLAVLPNSPALIHPGRNRDQLQQKRDRLLLRLLQASEIDSLTYSLSLDEPLPEKPLPLPDLAPHLLEKAYKDSPTPKSFQTAISRDLQEKVRFTLERHGTQLKGNQIHNSCALVAEVKTGKVRAYVGNIPNTGADHGEFVDIIQAPRSTGSILKPILFSLALQEGEITRQSLLSDIPTTISGYRPVNFHENYAGVIPAGKALQRSLNIPFVLMLQQYGIEKFHYYLRKMGMTTLAFSPDHYGLSLIIGGAEATLWDLAGMYASMGRNLHHYIDHNSQYFEEDFHPLAIWESDSTILSSGSSSFPILDAGAIWQTFDQMRQLERPNNEGQWEFFGSSFPIAWKTGTSYGFRDAWAIGVSPEYVVAVWAGNADGEGRPGLTGVRAAAPILFDIFDLLPSASWFSPPFDAMEKHLVCQQSGYSPLPHCPTDTAYTMESFDRLKVCPYHQLIHISDNTGLQVSQSCISAGESLLAQPWFVLPATKEYYYRLRNPSYEPLPGWDPKCRKDAAVSDRDMDLIYPNFKAKIYVPLDFDGKASRTVFKAAHRRPSATIFWHLDNQYLGKTEDFHQMDLAPQPGLHLITLVDDRGQRLQREFEIVKKEKY